jgi:TolA-binding protein
MSPIRLAVRQGAAFAAAFVVLSAGPALAGTSGPTADYAKQVTTVQMRAAELEQLLSDTRDRVSQLEESLRAQGQSEASRASSFDDISGEIAGLRGRIEVLEFKQAELDKSLAALQLSNERRLLHAESRLRQIEGVLGLKPPPPPTDQELGIASTPGAPSPPGTTAPAPDTAVAAPTDVPADAPGRLDAAVENMRNGKQTVARAILKQAIDQNTGAPELDEIRYRYAETYFNTGDYSRAAQEFQAVITNFPKSDWACWAYYRQGESFDKMGKNGKPFYQGATEGVCSKSNAAKEAKKKL